MAVPQRITRFGTGNQSYVFPNTIQSVSDNFKDIVTRIVKLPGVDGGFDEYGSDRAARETGRITVSFMLIARDPEEMTALRDEVNKMAGFGVKRLFMRPTDPNAAERFCYARLNNINIPEQPAQRTNLWQPVTCIFQAGDPTWVTLGNEAPRWGEFSWGGGALWGGGAGTAVAGVQTDLTISHPGTAVVPARIVIECGASESCQNPTVQRIVDGQVVDEVSYTGTLVATDSLEINARALSVKKNGANAYTSAFDFTHPAWFRIEPGDNAVRVLFANAGDEATVKILFYEGYY